MSIVIEGFKFFYEFLLPPSGSDPDRLYRWRVNVSITLGVLVMVLSIFVAIAFGMVNIFGFSGFAYASDVTDQKQQIVMMRAENLEQQIYDLNDKKCTALTFKNNMAARMYDQLINQRQDQYAKISQRRVAVPPCDPV